ncbi:MAG: KH domain-containing protein [Minicystis sp.]
MASSSSPLVNLVALIARSLVDQPDKVVVREVPGDRYPRIELSVAREDIGKVIGKDGRTAQSNPRRAERGREQGGAARAPRHPRLTGSTWRAA